MNQLDALILKIAIILSVLLLCFVGGLLMFPTSLDQKSQTLNQLCQQEFNTNLKHSKIEPSKRAVTPMRATDNIITIYCEVK